MDYIGLILFFVFISFALQPMLQALALVRQRAGQIAIIEKERGSRVITMIHRQETRAFFSIPITRMIDLEDAQEIIPAIVETPYHEPQGPMLRIGQVSISGQSL